ncbi:extracellular solute-binding protein [Cohnella sp. GCM10012308]|uniref:extracellular solute-binding protein n=1 Tax=Cohnella sp. GCM10012308 TaxID=3317329 RepID=UPI00361CC7E4
MKRTPGWVKAAVTASLGLLTIGLFAGGLGRLPGPEADKPAAGDRISVTIMPYSWEGGLRWREDHPMIQYLNDKFNVDLKLLWTDGESYKDKLQVMAASGKLPDVFQVEPDLFVNWQPKQAFLDLGPLLGAYPHLAGAFGQAEWNLLNPDGRAYGIPVNDVEFRDSYQIRADWLEKVGLPIPEEGSFTVNDFYRIVQAFALEDPDDDGANDTFGLSISNQLSGSSPSNSLQLRAAFGLANEWKLIDGELVSQYTQTAEMKKYLAFLAKLYAEGLLDRDFEDKGFGTIYEEFQTGRSGIMTYRPDTLRSDEQLLRGKDPGARLVQLPPPIGPGGDRGNPTNLQGVNKLVVNGRIDSAKQARILEMLDWWMSEAGSRVMNNGLKGLHYVRDDKGGYAATALADTDLPRLLSDWLFPGSDPGAPSVYTAPEVARFDENYYKKNAAYPYRNDAGGIEVLSLSYRWYYKKLEENFRQVQIQVIRGEKSLDAVDEASRVWRLNGGDRITAEVNDIYKRTKERA